jgi:hypothetical protein
MIPDTLSCEIEGLGKSITLVKHLWVLPRKAIQGLLHEVQHEEITANSLLSNGWSAGTFCMAYLRLLFLKKNLHHR